jgi:hypothetical protein
MTETTPTSPASTIDPTADPTSPAPPTETSVPAKFLTETGEVNVDALVKSYNELERLHSGQNPANPDSDPHDAARQAVENAGLDWAQITGKLAASGSLEDGDFAALDAIGIPKAIVDSYLQLAKNESQRQTEAAFNHVGGEAQMNELLGWAASNLSEAEISHYNGMLATRDGWKPALDVINAKMAASSKTAGEPNLQNGHSAPSGDGGYRSRAEMMKDMSSTQYQTDPAFRNKVAGKMAVSRFDLDR